MPYFSGQGKAYIAEVTNGIPGAFRFVGSVPELNIEFETDTLEHKEATSGQRLTDLRLLIEKNASVSMTLEEFDKENLALALFGDHSDLAGGSVTGESLAGGAVTLAIGDFIRLAEPNVSALTVEDSLAAPLVLNTDYRISSAAHGTIEILSDLAGFTGAFTADYTSGAAENVRMFSAGLTEKWLRFEGLNTVLANAPVLVEVYKTAFDPTEAMNLISDEVFQMVLSGSALADQTKEADATLGVFGRVVLNIA